VNRDFDKLNASPVNERRVMLLPDGQKLFISDYISYQNEKGKKGINPAIPAIKGIVNRLVENNMYEYVLREGFVRIVGSGILPCPTGKVFTGREEYISAADAAVGNTAGGETVDETGAAGAVGEAGAAGGIAPAEAPIAGVVLAEADNPVNSGSSKEEKNIFPLKPLPKKNNNDHCNTNQPLAGDKDKGRGMDSGSGNVFKNSSPEAEKLFLQVWTYKTPSAGDLKIADTLIETFGYAEVELGFFEAASHNRRSLAYVKGVCTKRREKAAIERAKEEARQKQRELNEAVRKAQEEGISLNLLEQVYGKNIPPRRRD
jgi:hypothetical protein